MPTVFEAGKAALNLQAVLLVYDFLNDQVFAYPNELLLELRFLEIDRLLHAPVVLCPAKATGGDKAAVGFPGQAWQREENPLHLKSGVLVKTLVKLGEFPQRRNFVVLLGGGAVAGTDG